MFKNCKTQYYMMSILLQIDLSSQKSHNIILAGFVCVCVCVKFDRLTVKFL